MAATARLRLLLPLVLLLAAASLDLAAAHGSKKAPYDCRLQSAPDTWALECSQAGACAITLPPNSFPSSASRVTCVISFLAEEQSGLFDTFASVLAAKSTPNGPVAEACVNSESEECETAASSQVRRATAAVTHAARKNGIKIKFPPKIYVPSGVQGTAAWAACLQQSHKHGARCSEDVDVQVLETEVACLPGDATVRRVVAGSDGKVETVRLDDLRLGDEVECVAPLGEGAVIGADPAGWADAAQSWKSTTCRVFYYLDASTQTSRFVALHYALADGTLGTFRATREHLAFVAAADVASSAGAPAPPRGSAKRMDAVAVGDLLSVRAPDGSFYTAPVTAITFETGPGAYAPLLTKAGLLVADNAVVFPHAHVMSNVPVHPMTNLGEFYRHGRIWTEFDNIVASGCEGDACPCLDSRRADGFCAKIGMRLGDLPQGVSTFTGRALEVLRKAHAEGRTQAGYETVLKAAPLIRAYLHATTRLPILRDLFRPTDGPVGDVTHRVSAYVMRAPTAVAAA